MKIAKYSILIIISATVGMLIGIYVGVKYHIKINVSPMLETIAVDESYELLKKSRYLEGLQNGHINNVKEVLAIEMKAGIESSPIVDTNKLSDKNRVIVEKNRKEVEKILKWYSQFPKN